MIHTLDTLTIRRYGIIDRTKRISLFRRWYNLLPIRFFNIESLITNISSGINSGVSKELAKETARIITYNTLLILETLETAIYNLIILKADNDKWGLIKTKRNLSNDLGNYILEVKDITGIQIKDIITFGRFRQEIKRRKAKFLERYKRKEVKTKEIPFTFYAYSIFLILETDYNPETTMNEFFELNTLAIKKAKQLENLKYKNG